MPDAVVASGIARLQIPHQLLEQMDFQFGAVVHLHAWKGEQFFQGRSKYFAVVLKYLTQEIFAGLNFCENPVFPPEEIFAVLINFCG